MFVWCPLPQSREVSQQITAMDEFIEKGTAMPAAEAPRPAQIRLSVVDVRAAAAFYTKAFDVVFVEEIASVQFGTYRSDRFFLLTLETREPAGGTHFGLLVADVDAAHERALAAGATEVAPPIDFAWKPRTSCVRDPSRNLIDLTQS